MKKSSARVRELASMIMGGAMVVHAVACSSTPDAAGRSSGNAGSSGSGTPGATGTFGAADAGGVDPASAGCSEEAKLVYVLSVEGDLYSFAPAQKVFTKIGPLDCGGAASGITYEPISMAVDRNAVAWVNMRDSTNSTTSDGFLFKVDTRTAACSPTRIAGSMGGMGFSTNDSSTDQESLYVVGSGTSGQGGLAKVDFAGEKLVPVSDLQDNVDMELTGTGDGRLYGFLISSPLALASIDKTTSATSVLTKLMQVETPLSPMFAFSFWGGDFYFYTATEFTSARSTNVTHYRPSDGTVDTSYMTNIGFHIVGAGVSTCAPTTQPK